MPLHATKLEALQLNPNLDLEVKRSEPMSKHTSYRIGGPADYFMRADSIEALEAVLSACDADGIPWTVVGRGTNLLVSDSGVDGAVVVLGSGFRKISVRADEGRIYAGAGALLSAVVQKAFDESLSGLEFAVGTPGSMGGAIRMNAGSATEWIGSRTASITAYRSGEGLVRIPGSDVEWGYRSSSIADGDVVVECELMVERGDTSNIQGRMEGLLAKRRRSQPLDLPSCGSVFKGADGTPAAVYIDKAGLKGTRIGGAEVSQKHANFIVNTGGATAEDVLALIRYVQSKVNEEYGIELEPEVRLLGFEEGA